MDNAEAKVLLPVRRALFPGLVTPLDEPDEERLDTLPRKRKNLGNKELENQNLRLSLFSTAMKIRQIYAQPSRQSNHCRGETPEDILDGDGPLIDDDDDDANDHNITTPK